MDNCSTLEADTLVKIKLLSSGFHSNNLICNEASEQQFSECGLGTSLGVPKPMSSKPFPCTTEILLPSLCPRVSAVTGQKQQGLSADVLHGARPGAW